MTIDEDDEDDLIVEGDVAEAEIEEPDSAVPPVDEGDGATAAEEAAVDSCIPELFTCGPGGHSSEQSSSTEPLVPTAFDPFYIAVDEEYQGTLKNSF